MDDKLLVGALYIVKRAAHHKTKCRLVREIPPSNGTRTHWVFYDPGTQRNFIIKSRAKIQQCGEVMVR